MKKLLSLIIAISAITVVNGQDIAQSEVPSVILNNFKLNFEKATDVDWEIKGEEYKVEFEINHEDHDVWFDKKGNVLKHKQDLSLSNLPTNIKQKIETDFKSYKIDDIDKIEIAGKTTFEVELESNAGDKVVVFSSDGKVENQK
ncbi:PepSY-like domain-containing protein [Pseudochryseolinea flava]|nr:PepSY-like domain-containing protein [Pseudochryseolinea flava]